MAGDNVWSDALTWQQNMRKAKQVHDARMAEYARLEEERLANPPTGQDTWWWTVPDVPGYTSRGGCPMCIGREPRKDDARKWIGWWCPNCNQC